MANNLTCSMNCGNEITRDRYSLALEIERQDFPPSGNWNKGYAGPLENVCSDCYSLIERYYIHIIQNIRKNGGKYKLLQIDPNAKV